jgi:hypothetical protein
MSRFNIKHHTHVETVVKFVLLLCVVLGYLVYLNSKYNFETSLYLAALNWAFFVLCTPIADAGFLLDFPIRLLFKVRMIFTEMFVWSLALILSISGVVFNPDIFSQTLLTAIFYKILVTPWPFWGLILLFCFGTFLSIYFGDEMLDVVTHKDRDVYHRHGKWFRLATFAAIIFIVLIAYEFLLTDLGLTLPS